MITCPENQPILQSFRERHERYRRRDRLIKSLGGELLDVVLDVAASAVDDFPDEVDQVETARDYLRAVLAGHAPSPLPKDELLFVAGVLIADLDIDCRCPELRADLDAELSELLDESAADRKARCSYCQTLDCPSNSNNR